MQVKSVNKQVMYEPLRLQKRGTMHRGSGSSLQKASADVPTAYNCACATVIYCDESLRRERNLFFKSGNGHVFPTCALVFRVFIASIRAHPCQTCALTGSLLVLRTQAMARAPRKSTPNLDLLAVASKLASSTQARGSNRPEQGSQDPLEHDDQFLALKAAARRVSGAFKR